MDQIALFFNNFYLYWHGVFMAASLLLAVMVALLFSAAVQRQRTRLLIDTLLLALPLGLLLSRLLYCVNNFGEEYFTIGAMLKLSEGGYVLYGAIFGALLAAWILQMRKKPGYDMHIACDSMAVGGALGIAAGKMASYFSCDNVGIEITNPKFQFFPFSVYNAAEGEWLLAVFTLESLFGAVIFGVLCYMFLRNNNERKGMRGRHGDIALLFLLLHGTSQGIFDSMHMDALKLPGNGFIRIQQILGAVCIAVVMGIFVYRSVRKNTFRPYHVLCAAGTLAMIGLAAFMALDRISNTNWYHHHTIMFFAMLADAILGVIMYNTTIDSPQRPAGETA